MAFLAMLLLQLITNNNILSTICTTVDVGAHPRHLQIMVTQKILCAACTVSN
jgi:hypothetical protein